MSNADEKKNISKDTFNQDLQKLIQANKLDWEVSKFNPLIEEKREPIAKVEQERVQFEKEKAALENKIIEQKELLSKVNDELVIVEQEMEKVQAKLKDSKSEKEIKNLGMEEDILREKVAGFNNEISNIEAFIKQSEGNIENLKTRIEESGKAILDMQESCSGAIEEIKKSQSEVSTKRDSVIIGMDINISKLYEKIKKWAGNTSVIPIYKDACGGCFIKLNEKNLIDIRKAAYIVHCPHCGRILYDKDIYEERCGVKKEKSK